MPYEIGLFDTGLVVPRTSDYIVEVRTRFEGLIEAQVNWESDLLLASLTGIMGQLLGEQAEVIQAVYDAWDPGAARGVQLANLSQLSGIGPKNATKGQTVATLSGDAGTPIPKGRVVQGGGPDKRARWKTLSDVTLGGNGEADVLVEAEQAGRLIALPGEIDTIVTPVTGWSGVTNKQRASEGQPSEPDDQLRVRRLLSLQTASTMSVPALRGRLLKLGFVESVSVIDNPDNEPKVIEGIYLPEHSVRVIILPDTMTADQQSTVIRTIYDNVPASTRAYGTDVVSVITGPDGTDREIGFDYAAEIPATIVVAFGMAPGYSASEALTVLRRRGNRLIGTLQVGEPLLQLKLAGLAADIPGVQSMLLTINGGYNLFPTATQRVVSGPWSLL
jgi:hypothetical protein